MKVMADSRYHASGATLRCSSTRAEYHHRSSRQARQPRAIRARMVADRIPQTRRREGAYEPAIPQSSSIRALPRCVVSLRPPPPQPLVLSVARTALADVRTPSRSTASLPPAITMSFQRAFVSVIVRASDSKTMPVPGSSKTPWPWPSCCSAHRFQSAASQSLEQEFRVPTFLESCWCCATSTTNETGDYKSAR